MFELPLDVTIQHPQIEPKMNRATKSIILTLRDLNSCYNNQHKEKSRYKHHNGLQIDLFDWKKRKMWRRKDGSYHDKDIENTQLAFFHGMLIPIPAEQNVIEQYFNDHFGQSFDSLMRICRRSIELPKANADVACPYPEVGGGQKLVQKGGLLWYRRAKQPP